MKTKYGSEARELLMKSISEVAKAVKSTLGAGGRTVMIESPYAGQKPIVTKDGVTVAKAIETHDKELALGINFIKEVSMDTNTECGDGSSTSLILAEALARLCVDKLDQGADARNLKNGFDKAIAFVVEYILDNAIQVRDNPELLRQVAVTSANNDEALGNLVYEAFKQVNFEGIVQLAPVKNAFDGVTLTQGTKFPRGYVSPIGINNDREGMFDFEDCNILITDHIINDLINFQSFIKDENGKEIEYNVLNELADDSVGKNKPLLIICDDMETTALTKLNVNIMQGRIRMCTVKAPDYGTLRDDFLSDLALLTGGRYISTKLGDKLADVRMSDIGSAKTVQVSRDFTLIKEGAGDQEAVQELATALKDKLQIVPKEEKEELEKRLSKLTGGIAELTVGASSTSELGEKRDRAEDAINAVRSAYEEGIVEGGGTLLLRASNELAKYIDEDDTITARESIGARVVIQGLLAPFITILENAGYDDYKKIKRSIDDKNYRVVFNVITGNIEYANESMIVDPAKVTRHAVQNAASVVGTLITTDCIVYRPVNTELTSEDIFVPK